MGTETETTDLIPGAKLLETVTLPERCRALMALLAWDVASDDGQPRSMQ